MKIKSLSILLFSFVVMASCEKSHEVANDSPAHHLKIEKSEIGEEHNNVLEFVKLKYSNNSFRTIKSTVSNSGVLNTMHEYSIDYYGKKEVNPHQKSYLESLSLMEKDQLKLEFDKVAHESTLIFEDQDLRSAILQLVEMAQSGKYSIEECHSFIEANLTHQKWGDDQENLNVFLDVWRNSYEFWSNEGSDSINKMNQNQEIIVADAIGALHGLVFGAVGSIIEGAFWSYMYA
jgi:hypothetical protein